MNYYIKKINYLAKIDINAIKSLNELLDQKEINEFKNVIKDFKNKIDYIKNENINYLKSYF